ncbi:MAG TPA: VOC family protein [Candidatus Thermoplasmatota archaeon]|nr:VOC family protein [Candidatus Thermoplasmatota archaeon]
MRPNLSVVTLAVADLARAVRFYRDGLGLPVANAWEEQGVAFVWCHGVVLSLFPRSELAKDAQVDPSGSGFHGVALAHNARDRDEVRAVLAEAERAGARVTKPAQETFWGGYAGYFEDPDGHLWEVAHNPFWPLDEAGRIARLPP